MGFSRQQRKLNLRGTSRLRESGSWWELEQSWRQTRQVNSRPETETGPAGMQRETESIWGYSSPWSGGEWMKEPSICYRRWLLTGELSELITAADDHHCNQQTAGSLVDAEEQRDRRERDRQKDRQINRLMQRQGEWGRKWEKEEDGRRRTETGVRIITPWQRLVYRTAARTLVSACLPVKGSNLFAKGLSPKWWQRFRVHQQLSLDSCMHINGGCLCSGARNKMFSHFDALLWTFWHFLKSC